MGVSSRIWQSLRNILLNGKNIACRKNLIKKTDTHQSIVRLKLTYDREPWPPSGAISEQIEYFSENILKISHVDHVTNEEVVHQMNRDSFEDMGTKVK